MRAWTVNKTAVDASGKTVLDELGNPVTAYAAIALQTMEDREALRRFFVEQGLLKDKDEDVEDIGRLSDSEQLLKAFRLSPYSSATITCEDEEEGRKLRNRLAYRQAASHGVYDGIRLHRRGSRITFWRKD